MGNPFTGLTGETTMLSVIYRGYNISPLSSIIGLAWGVIDGFIGGLILAWVYNRLTSLFSNHKLA